METKRDNYPMWEYPNVLLDFEKFFKETLFIIKDKIDLYNRYRHFGEDVQIPPLTKMEVVEEKIKDGEWYRILVVFDGVAVMRREFEITKSCALGFQIKNEYKIMLLDWLLYGLIGFKKDMAEMDYKFKNNTKT